MTNNIERHAQSVVLAVLTAIIMWVGASVQESTVKLATISEKLAGVERQLAEYKEQSYTARDAQKDLQLRDALLADLTSRVSSLENGKRR